MNQLLASEPTQQEQAILNSPAPDGRLLAAMIRLIVQIRRFVLLTKILGPEKPTNKPVYDEQRILIAQLMRVFSEAFDGASPEKVDELGHYLFHNVEEAILKPLAIVLHEHHNKAIGIANTMRISLAYNRLKYGNQDAFRREQYEKHIDELLRGNGSPKTPLIEMKDGWAIDNSMSLPFLNEVLEDSDRIIAERGGIRRTSTGAYRSHFQNTWKSDDVQKYPSIMNFAMSSEILGVASHYLKCIPALSTTLPPGIRFVESNAAFDDRPNVLHDSQLFHIDYYSYTNIYVIVLLRDVTSENGPFSFLPRALSQRVAKAVNNWGRGVPYHFQDEQIYSVADKKDLVEFTGKRGSVLFFESSGCYHYGSRNCVKPRFQLMLGYTAACRTDMSEVYMTPETFKTTENDSRLRTMVLNKYFID